MSLVAVVGSRSLPLSWRPRVSAVVSSLLNRGFSVVSGGALGADLFALRASRRRSRGPIGLFRLRGLPSRPASPGPPFNSLVAGPFPPSRWAGGPRSCQAWCSPSRVRLGPLFPLPQAGPFFNRCRGLCLRSLSGQLVHLFACRFPRPSLSACGHAQAGRLRGPRLSGRLGMAGGPRFGQAVAGPAPSSGRPQIANQSNRYLSPGEMFLQ
ncbi:MAG: DNA-processing protein DprA [Deltaproteobacteria bacterium]|nr:DNA-processing protein DprA [Deltaproteobacteria bacterium]